MSETFRPCGLVPSYNNPQTVEKVVDKVHSYINDVIVVDDGSDPPGRTAIDRLASKPGIVVVRHDNNGGKGAAVKSGLKEAARLGFTHALQVDADGQHDLPSIPKFLERAQQQPDALVLGAPRFDETSPAGRRFGRLLTIFWTRIEVGGRAIEDPMCGFRVYPVEAANKAGAWGNRMDFDPEIAVRICWQGVPVVNLPTAVRYLRAEEGGVSHFRMVLDNVLISWMHTRLFFGMLFRRLTGGLDRAT